MLRHAYTHKHKTSKCFFVLYVSFFSSRLNLEKIKYPHVGDLVDYFDRVSSNLTSALDDDDHCKIFISVSCINYCMVIVYNNDKQDGASVIDFRKCEFHS